MDMEEIIALVEKAKNGDQSAITQLYEATSKAVYFTALKIVGNPSDAEDIAQDTYVTAISKLSDLKDNATFPKWIKTIAANTAKNYMIKKKPMLFNTDEDEEAALGSIPEISEDFLPETAADKNETSRLISDMIDKLPEKQRMAVIMYYYDEMEISEIAEMMETNDSTIKSRLNYARKYIKDEVETLEKKGTRLYSVAAVPVLAAALKNTAEEIAVPETVAAGVNTTVSSMAAAAAGAGIKIAVVSAIAATAVTVPLVFVVGANPDEFYFKQEPAVTEEAVQTTAAQRENEYIASDMGLEITETDDATAELFELVTEEVTTEEVTKAPEVTTEEITTEEVTAAAPETTPVQEETNLGKVTYNADNYQIRENNVDIYPAAAWYEGEKFVVNCYITNGFSVDKIVTDVPIFIINDKNGNEIVNAKFDSVGRTVPAGNYVMHTFTFSGAALLNTKADYSSISWDISTNFSDVSAPVTSLGTASQTVMGGKVKLTAEKKSNNTIVLTVENNFDMEVSTFGYPQIKVNGIMQDLDSQLQLQNGTQTLSVPAGEKGQITYYVSGAASVEALIGEMFAMAPSVTDRDFKLVF